MSPHGGPQPPPRGGSAMRLRGLVRKEFLQIMRDPSSLAIAFVLPVVLLLLFGYGVSLNAAHVPIAVVMEQESPEAMSFMATLHRSKYFDPLVGRSMRQAKEDMAAGTVAGIVRLRADFADTLRNPAAGPAAIQVLVNGVDSNNANIIKGYLIGVYSTWLQHLVEERGQTTPALPVDLRVRVWFNSAFRSQNYLVPGLIVVIMTLIGALLTALVMSREWERGTLEALMVTPVPIHEVLLGKLIPYFLLGMGGLTLSVVMALGLFHVPLRGSLWVLFSSGSLFMLAALGMGLLISVVAKSQFVAGLAAIIAAFLPAFILSGFIFDLGSMPRIVQWITHLIAARYFVAILQTVFLAGNVWAVVVPNALALAVMAVFFLGVSVKRSRKRLE